MQSNNQCVCEKTRAEEKSVGYRKTRTADTENVNFINNDCMHQMTRNAQGVVKLPIRIYLCPECQHNFFINPIFDSNSGGLQTRRRYCIYCGAPIRDEYRMFCKLTPECFNPDKTKCECKKEHSVISNGMNPYTNSGRNPNGAAFVRSVCSRIILSNTDEQGITGIPMHYCKEHKLVFTGNSEQRIEYCLYCGGLAHDAEHVCCWLTKFCYDLKNICENYFDAIR